MKIMNNQAFSKIWIMVILVALIGGGILIGNYLSILNIQNNNGMNEEISEDETADWETYQSSGMDFSIKYPSNFRIEEGFDIGGTYRPDTNRITFSHPEIGMQIGIEVWTKFGEGFATLQEWSERRKDDLTNPTRGINEVFESKEDIITLDKIPAKRISIINATKSGKGQWIEIFVQNQERMYVIYADIAFVHKDIAIPIFNQMLSSFKFAENTFEDEKSYIEILSPNGGEQWTAGETYDITWTSSGIEKVSIEIMGSGHGKILGIVDADDEKFAWTIPASYASSADSTDKTPRLKISISKFSGQSDISDISDDYFSVLKK